jgi:hypothetical protein
MLNNELPRFNARWCDPQCKDVDCLHLPDAAWRRKNNYCNPPLTALATLAAKLRLSDAIATVLAPYWPNNPWFQDMYRLASHTPHFPPTRDLFLPGKLGTRAGVRPPRWSIVVFRVVPMRGSTPAATQ